MPLWLQVAAQAVAVSQRATPSGCNPPAAWRISSHSVTCARVSLLPNKGGEGQIRKIWWKCIQRGKGFMSFCGGVHRLGLRTV